MSKKDNTLFEDIMQGLKEAIAYKEGTGTARVMLYEGDNGHGKKLVMDKRGTKAEIETEKVKKQQNRQE